MYLFYKCFHYSYDFEFILLLTLFKSVQDWISSILLHTFDALSLVYNMLVSIINLKIIS